MFHPFITGTAYTDPDMEPILVRNILPMLHRYSTPSSLATAYTDPNMEPILVRLIFPVQQSD